MPMEMYEEIKTRPSLVPLPHPKAIVQPKLSVEGEEKGSTFVEYPPYLAVVNLPNDPKFIPSYERPKTATASSKELDKKRGKDMPPEL
jgi:hypothetical protein